MSLLEYEKHIVNHNKTNLVESKTISNTNSFEETFIQERVNTVLEKKKD